MITTSTHSFFKAKIHTPKYHGLILPDFEIYINVAIVIYYFAYISSSLNIVFVRSCFVEMHSDHLVGLTAPTSLPADGDFS